MLKVILSPAKRLTFRKDETLTMSKPLFINEATQINFELKDLSVNALKDLMGISLDLANLNWQRYQEWSPQGAYAAGFCFDGEAYRGLDIRGFSPEKLKVAQEKLYILSGMYGLLKPLDAISPYRLEMGTPISINHHKNLYDFWSEKIAHQLNKELGKGVLVNVTSEEYFKVINRKKLESRVINCFFKDFKDGKLKTLVVYTKKARGAMARFIIENNIQNPEELKLFNTDHYAFDDSLSTENDFVFTR